jgi:uroporphyrin-3 C-methyltransferase
LKTGSNVTNSNEALPTTAAAPSNPKKEASKKSTSWPLVVLVLLLAVFSILSAIYFWQNQQQQSSLISHLSAQSSSDKQKIQTLERNLERRLSSVEGHQKQHIEKLTTLDRQSLYNTQVLTELGASSRADWLLAEAEYLLHLANQRLALEHDVKSTETILISADKILTEINDPGLLPIREALNKEIFALQQLAYIDHEGVYIKLSAMISSLDTLNESAFLALEQAQATPEAEAPAIAADNDPVWKKVWQEVWADLKQAVVIRRLDQPVSPLLAPEQNYYLKQNLRLMLEQASLALLEKNEPIFQHSIKQADQWLKNYFDVQDSHTRSLLEALEALSKLPISYEKPDISNSLRLLKTKIEAMYLNHSLGKLSNMNTDGNNAGKQEPKE